MTTLGVINNSGIERHASSLPSLDITIPVPVIKPVPQKSSRVVSGEALTYIVSAFYAKILVIFGVALPVTDSIATDNETSYVGFYVYLYVGSVIFLIYMFTHSVKERTLKSNPEEKDDKSDVIPLSQHNKQYIRYGSFYFRTGVTGFGLGSVIYSGLQLGQYFELSSDNGCNDILKAAKPAVRIVFVLMQMLFIFSYSNFMAVQKSKLLAKVGLMHMIATNLCEWLYVLVQETQHDIFLSAKRRQDNALRDNQTLSDVDIQFLSSKSFQITKQMIENQNNCLNSNIMMSILQKSEPYLAPCTVEYSLLCAVILGVMWKNSCQDSQDTDNEVDAMFIQRDKGQRIQRQNKFSVDCAEAHKGMFSGIMVLTLTTTSLIMFFELVSYKQYKDIAVLQVNVWEAILFATATVAAVMCIVALRDVGLRTTVVELELEHLLLLVTQSGLFMYFLFQVIGAALMGLNKGRGGLMRIITPITALIQSCCQTVLILDAWRRHCTTSSQIRQKPARQLITFLLLVNISLWIVNRIKNNRAFSHPNQMDFYGVLAWNIITHVTMPLVVSYRFQSTVCFYEIWKKVYKSRSSFDDGNSNVEDDP
ncbi:proton channel OtopLc-like [Agrilus planipennis]|uniref:Proton channel OtopLc-like n=1 Tax=Agrilus planipennis TaxID=224129 RepID=A0A7F5R776_AGRPL|nr:proton channel OtopLc-like [Agrilus planipennis]